jgi:hypothetical protein
MIISGTQHYAATLIYAFIATTGVAAGLLFLAFDGKYHALVILYYAVAAAVMLVIFVKKKE